MRLRRLIIQSKKRLGLHRFIKWFEGQIPTHSRVGTSPLIPHDKFPWAGVLERDWRQIREELDGMMTHYDALPNMQDISAEQEHLTQDDRWKSFFFVGFGNKVEANCRLCPRTAALLENIPGVTTAFFSILGPGKHLEAHTGIYRGVVRYHLALKVPDDESGCAIRVADEVVHWSEGVGFFFDDTYEHEAWNKTSEVRVVLLLDVMRPLSFPYSWLNKAIIYAIARTRFVRDAKTKHEAWERKFEQVLAGK
jgi:ornithine lipid ester-linked acyl 2-hydroxylase